MHHARLAALAVLTAILSASTASAQGANVGAWEIGTDAQVTLGLDDPMFLAVQIPGGMVRAGYFTSPTVSIEPLFRWLSVAQKEQEGFSSYTIGVGVLFHRSADRTRRQVYLRPFLTLTDGSGGGSGVMTIGGGLGLKRPVFGGRATSRGEVNVSYNEASEALSLNGLFGLSIYSR